MSFAAVATSIWRVTNLGLLAQDSPSSIAGATGLGAK
jgi:hypothetical protein